MTGWWKVRKLRRRLNRPSPAMQSIVRRLKAHLDSAPDTALALVEIGSAEPAAVAIAALAHQSALEGRRVVLADVADGRPLAALLRARGGTGINRAVSVRGHQVDLYVAPSDPAQMADFRPDSDADVVLVLATVDPAVGADHLAVWVKDAVVMVRSGESTTPRIIGVAKQLQDARVLVRAGLLIDSDRHDHSSGVPAGRRGSVYTADLLLETLKTSTR